MKLVCIKRVRCYYFYPTHYFYLMPSKIYEVVIAEEFNSFRQYPDEIIYSNSTLINKYFLNEIEFFRLKTKEKIERLEKVRGKRE